MAEKFGLNFTIVDSAPAQPAQAQSRQRRQPVPRLPADDRQPQLAARCEGRTAPARGHRGRRRQAPLRPADPGRGSPRRPGRAEAALRGRLSADQTDPLARPALRAPAVPVRDAAQRLPRVVHRAAGDHRRPALRPRRRPRSRGAEGHRDQTDEESDHRGRRGDAEVRETACPGHHRHLPGHRTRKRTRC